MPVSIKGTGGGSVTLDAGAAAADTTLTLPNTSGTLLQSGTAVTAAQGGTGLTSPGTAGNVLTSTGSAWASSAPASSVPSPSAIGQVPFSTDGSTWTATQKIFRGTSVATTSGTSIDITGIPSWVKRVTIMVYGVSTNGNAYPRFQIGAGSIDTTNYNGTGVQIYSGATAGVTLSAGFDVIALNAANLLYGQAVLTNMDSSNSWNFSFTGATTTGNQLALITFGGHTLSGSLDRVRLTTANGTDSFDAGTVNILYE